MYLQSEAIQHISHAHLVILTKFQGGRGFHNHFLIAEDRYWPNQPA